MTDLAHRSSPGWAPGISGWPGQPWMSFLPFGPAHTFRVEDCSKDGRYIVRAELPGLDPDRDIQVRAEAGIMTIQAERREDEQEAHRSEFRYGSSIRTVTLPAGADTDKITASYDKGILEVRVPMAKQAKPEVRRIAIQHAH